MVVGHARPASAGQSPRWRPTAVFAPNSRLCGTNAVAYTQGVTVARFQSETPTAGHHHDRSREKPIETPLSLERRTALRSELLAETPSWYVPWVHLFVPSLCGIIAIAVALSFIRDLHPLELLTVPAVYCFANAFEWWIHGAALHRRHVLAPVLYDQHTPKHHMLYLTDDMAIRDTREYRLVLIPAFGLFLIFVGQIPINIALRWLGYPNVAWLYLATSIGYAVSYEWLHFSYHLPHEHPVARNAIIKRLARHHAVHHDPRIMQRWNMNVTVPLMDHVMGTAVDSVDEAVRRRAARAHAV
jgi:hypothetical protein